MHGAVSSTHHFETVARDERRAGVVEQRRRERRRGNRPEFETHSDDGRRASTVERNGVTIVHRLPYSAINFYTYENTLGVHRKRSRAEMERERVSSVGGDEKVSGRGVCRVLFVHVDVSFRPSADEIGGAEDAQP